MADEQKTRMETIMETILRNAVEPLITRYGDRYKHSWFMINLLKMLDLGIAMTVVIPIVGFIPTVIVILVWPFTAAAFLDYLRPHLASTYTRIAALLGFALLGIVLYGIRQSTLRIAYGIAEFCVGLMSCWTGLSQLNQPEASNLTISIALAGGVYILVRGTENTVQGYDRLRQNKFRIL